MKLGEFKKWLRLLRKNSVKRMLKLSIVALFFGYFLSSGDITSHSDSEQVLQLLGPLDLQLLDVS